MCIYVSIYIYTHTHTQVFPVLLQSGEDGNIPEDAHADLRLGVVFLFVFLLVVLFLFGFFCRGESGRTFVDWLVWGGLFLWVYLFWVFICHVLLS